MPAAIKASGSVSFLNCGFFLERGTVRTSRTCVTSFALNRLTNSSSGWVECPMVHTRVPVSAFPFLMFMCPSTLLHIVPRLCPFRRDFARTQLDAFKTSAYLRSSPTHLLAFRLDRTCLLMPVCTRRSCNASEARCAQLDIRSRPRLAEAGIDQYRLLVLLLGSQRLRESIKGPAVVAIASQFLPVH